MWSVGRESTGMMQVMLDPSNVRVGVGDSGIEFGQGGIDVPVISLRLVYHQGLVWY